jgi:hypothetical protein
MARAFPWIPDTPVSLAASVSWQTPPDLQCACADHRSAYALVEIRNFDPVEDGTLSVYLETAPAASDDDGAWTSVAAATEIDETTVIPLAAPRSATTPVMERLRLRLLAVGHAITCSVRAQLLLKEPASSLSAEWLPATRLSFGSAEDQIMSPEKWIEATPWSEAFLFCEYESSSGSADNLAVVLESAVGPDADDDAWLELARATMATGSAVLVARDDDAPLGVLRLRYDPAAALSGTLRAVLLLKGA